MNATNRKKRDFIAISLIPLQLLLGWLIKFFNIPLGQYISVFIAVSLITASVFILIKIYGDKLKKDWAEYRKIIGLKILFSIGGAVAIGGILFVVRLIMAPFMPTTSTTAEGSETVYPLAIAFFISLIPLLNAFQEEVIFRHVIFYKFKDSKKYISVTLFLLSAFLFGLVHLNNFNGNFFATIPYMTIGAFFNLVYLFKKNIWYPIGVHLVFNFVMGFLPVIFVSLMQHFIL